MVGLYVSDNGLLQYIIILLMSAYVRSSNVKMLLKLSWSHEVEWNFKMCPWINRELYTVVILLFRSVVRGMCHQCSRQEFQSRGVVGPSGWG